MATDDFLNNRNSESGLRQKKSPQEERERLILERILSLKQFIEVDGGEARDFHELGICYYYLKNYEQAISYLEELFERYPSYEGISDAKAFQLFCKIRSGRCREALRLADRLIAEFPEDLRLVAMKAYCLDKLGKSKEAIRLHRSILEKHPDNTNSLNSLGYLLTLHGTPGDLPEAVSCLRRALEKNPHSPAYLDSFGVLLMKQGNKKSAKKALSRALQQSPECAEILEHYRELVRMK